MSMTIQEAIEKYRRSLEVETDSVSCFGITPRLAAGCPLTTEQLELLNTLNNGIISQEGSKKQETFYRGTSWQLLKNYPLLKPFVYRPFFSASRDIAEACRFLNKVDPVLLKIESPSGQKYLDVSCADIATLENQEVLFQSGLTIKISEASFSDLDEMQQIALQFCCIHTDIKLFQMQIMTNI